MADFYTDFFISGNTLHIRNVNDLGEDQYLKMTPKPTLYSKKNGPSKHIGFDGTPLEKIEFQNMKNARDFIEQMEYADSAHNIYGFNRFEYVEVDKLYPGDEVEFDMSKVRIASLDIETECEEGFPNIEEADQVVNAITVQSGDHTYCFGLWDLKEHDIVEHCKKENIVLDKFEYMYCSSEDELLRRFLHVWSRVMRFPHIVTGWNIEAFDIPYLVHRIERILGEGASRKLSPFKRLTRKEATGRYGNKYTKYIVRGVETLDYLQLYIKFTYSVQSSYALGHIATVELGDTKVDYSEEGGSLHTLYLKNPLKFIVYNIKDVDIVRRLEHKMKLIELAATIAYSAKVRYSDVFMNVRVWDVIISNYLRNHRNQQVKAVVPRRSSNGYDGGYVKDPLRGKYDWVMSFDYTSLYPRLIMQYNMSPDTLVKDSVTVSPDDVLAENARYKKAIETANRSNCSLAANGSMYSNEQDGFLPVLMKIYFQKRLDAKKKMIAAQTEHQKIMERISQLESV